jgi:lysophospholipase L1-like esterase
MLKRIIAGSLFLSIHGAVFSQDTIGYAINRNFAFINQEENRLQNSTSLSTFFEKLYLQKKNKNQKISILHIGDSHIQADFLTSKTRQLLQTEFGNAGRGLIFPGRVARTNEPQNIYSNTNAQWESKRIVFTDKPLPIGIGAITLRTVQPNAKVGIRTFNLPPIDNAFNKLTLFFQKDSASFNLAVKDSVGQDLAYVGSFSLDGYRNSSTVLLPYYVNKIELQCLVPLPKQSQLILYGISLENQKSGVLYHAIGGNGAKVRHYLAAEYFVQQTATLQPDLIIISLGTNEAIEYPYVDSQFNNQLLELITKLKANNPQTQILITTTADFYKKRTRRNPGVEVIRKKILEACDQNNWAYWDLYEVAGGKHAADQWKKNKLLQSEGIHFTKAGYELQGTLLYQAFLKAYNEYVLYRHP